MNMAQTNEEAIDKLDASSIHVIVGHDSLMTLSDVAALLSADVQNVLVDGGGIVAAQCTKMMGSVVRRLVDANEDVEVVDDVPEMFVAKIRNDGELWRPYEDLARTMRQVWRPGLGWSQTMRTVYVALPRLRRLVVGNYYVGQMVAKRGDLGECDDLGDHATRVSSFKTVFRGTTDFDEQLRISTVKIEATGSTQEVMCAVPGEGAGGRKALFAGPTDFSMRGSRIVCGCADWDRCNAREAVPHVH